MEKGKFINSLKEFLFFLIFMATIILDPFLVIADNNIFDDKLTNKEKGILSRQIDSLEGLSKEINALELAFLYMQFEKGDCKEFIKIEGKAKQGDPESQWILADLYHLGYCVGKNDKDAFFWLKKSATQNYEQSFRDIAIYYQEGFGVEANSRQAAHWFEKSAGKGDSLSQYFLAEMYSDGKGVIQNYDMARKWYTKAAESGYYKASAKLALKLIQGELGHKNFKEGLKWALFGAEKGDGMSQYVAGKILVLENTGFTNFIQAHKWANLAAQTNNEEIKKIAIEFRSQIEQILKKSELLKAQSLARDWKPTIKESTPEDTNTQKTSLPKLNETLADNLTPKKAKQTLIKLNIPVSKDSFFQAVREDNLSVFKLFHKAGADLETRGGIQGITALYDAVDFGSKKVFRYVMNHKAEVNVINLENGMTPLVRAIAHERWNMVFELLNGGADASQPPLTLPENQRSLLSGTALAYALMFNKPELTRILLEKGGSVKERYIYNRTPIMEAAEKDSVENVKILIKYGADLNAIDHFGKTPIYYAIKEGPVNYGILKLLLGNGANPSHKDPAGMTPLFGALIMGDSIVIKLLLEYGADPNESYFLTEIPFSITDPLIEDLIENGGSPLMVASGLGHASAIKVLLEAGANREKTINGTSGRHSPKSVAEMKGNPVIVGLFQNN
jgi:ankyrin repeat protein/TPR repeat protein